MPPCSKDTTTAAISTRKKSHPYSRPSPPPPSDNEIPSTDSKKKKKKGRKSKGRASDVSVSVTSQVPVSPVSVVPPSVDKGEKKKRKKKNRQSRSREMVEGVVVAEGDGDPSQPSNGTSVVSSQIHPTKSATPSRSPNKVPLVLTATEINTPAGLPKPLSKLTEPIKKDMARASMADREILRMREEAKKREAMLQELAVAREEMQRLRKVADGAKTREDDLKKQIETLKLTATAGQKEKAALKEIIERHHDTKNDLSEAVNCTVCFESYSDPHLLSCGHMACKECLTQWFRSPAAYKRPPQTITSETDLSYYTKICHVCRCNIIRRPVRAFFLRSVMEPLGLYQDSPVPTEGIRDPWRLIFPYDPTSYRLFDNADCCQRCPECMGEIATGVCTNCDIEFSESEHDGDYLDDFQGEEEGLFDSVGEANRFFDNLYFGQHRNLFPALGGAVGDGEDEDEDVEEGEASEGSDADSVPESLRMRSSELGADEDDDYEDSFIDDDEESQYSFSGSGTPSDAGDDHAFLGHIDATDEGDGRRGSRAPIIHSLSGEESESDVDEPVFMGRSRRILSDSE